MAKNVSLRPSKLLDKTIQLLRARPRTKTLSDVAHDTGLPLAWIESLISKPGLAPAVDRIEILYEYLAQKNLQV